ncbi:MAG TPA: hybrid sensor histidine kinase/response regulator [Anaeromyxobacter sp.]|nr:hybrid sensor histidine kinase/response regulator [Anaeromyxobacter sp.]
MGEQGGTVLCVDDDEATRYAVRRTLERGGFQVALAQNGEEALEKVRLRTDLVVLDVQLPGMNGREVCRRIKADPTTAAIPVIHLSATFVEPLDHVLGLESGADAYLAEPINPDVLLATVRALIRARHAELDRARLNEELREALQAREDVLAVVSHDLRNPLSTVLLGTHHLARFLEGLAASRGRDEALKRVGAIRRAAHRASGLVNDLLELARMEAGRIQMRLEPVDGEMLVREALDALRPLAQERSVQLVAVARGTVEVACERERIHRVFANLVDNALKFSPSGATVEVGIEPRGEEVVFWVADHGCGIDAEQMPHVFDRYWQARQRTEPGVGLGLSIAKGIVEAHGGRIWVESRVGIGSTFSFSLRTLRSRAEALDASALSAQPDRGDAEHVSA